MKLEHKKSLNSFSIALDFFFSTEIPKHSLKENEITKRLIEKKTVFSCNFFFL